MTVYCKTFSSAWLTCNFTFSGNWDKILHILWKSFRWSPIAILEAQIWNQAVWLEAPYLTSLGFNLITFEKYVFALQDYFAGVTVLVWCRVCWRWSSVYLEFSRASCWVPIPGLSSCHSSLPATISHCVDLVWGLSTFGWSEWCSHLCIAHIWSWGQPMSSNAQETCSLTWTQTQLPREFKFLDQETNHRENSSHAKYSWWTDRQGQGSPHSWQWQAPWINSTRDPKMLTRQVSFLRPL